MTSYWGNRQWYWYHLISYSAPEKIELPIERIYIELLYYMTKLLPCHKCYDHFKEHVKKYPIKFNSRDNMIKWFIEMHNEVNISLNKKIYTLEEANQIYLEMDDDSIKESKSKLKLKPINHLYLNQFIKYHSDRAVYNHASLILTVKMTRILINIYPCQICREIIKEYDSFNPLVIYGSTIPTFRKWIDNFFNHQDLSNHFCKNWKNMKK
jgi:cytidine deaminase